MAADCTNRRAITLAEWNAVKGDMVKEEEEVQIEPPEEEEEEIIVEPDKGEMLVLRKGVQSKKRYVRLSSTGVVVLMLYQ